MAAEPFIATCVTIPRRISSMSTGARPVFTTWPPSMTTTPRERRAASAIASITARKSRATRTSGSAWRKARNERSEPGGCAKSRALTLLGRTATGTVRTAARSASPAARRLRLGARARRGWAVRFEIEVEGSERETRLHLEHDAGVVVRKPDLGVAVLREDSSRLDHGLDHERVELPRRHADALAAEHTDRDGIAVGAEVALEGVRLA